jgi:hypothetical protein
MDEQHVDSAELKRFLLLAELVRHVNLPSEPKPYIKPRWQVFLESSGGTALITVFVGGIVAATVGQYLTYRYQHALRQREVATATYEAYLKRSDETLVHSFLLVGRVVSASEDLIRVAHPRSRPAKYPTPARSQIMKQHNEIVEAFQSATTAWRTERSQQALLLQYYHNAAPEVSKAWEDLQRSVSVYSDCAVRLYWYTEAHDGSPVWGVGCIGEHRVLLANLDRFTKARMEAAKGQSERSHQED